MLQMCRLCLLVVPILLLVSSGMGSTSTFEPLNYGINFPFLRDFSAVSSIPKGKLDIEKCPYVMHPRPIPSGAGLEAVLANLTSRFDSQFQTNAAGTFSHTLYLYSVHIDHRCPIHGWQGTEP